MKQYKEKPAWHPTPDPVLSWFRLFSSRLDYNAHHIGIPSKKLQYINTLLLFSCHCTGSPSQPRLNISFPFLPTRASMQISLQLKFLPLKPQFDRSSVLIQIVFISLELSSVPWVIRLFLCCCNALPDHLRAPLPSESFT